MIIKFASHGTNQTHTDYTHVHSAAFVCCKYDNGIAGTQFIVNTHTFFFSYYYY
jgi:hypothetical protein